MSRLGIARARVPPACTAPALARGSRLFARHDLGGNRRASPRLPCWVSASRSVTQLCFRKCCFDPSAWACVGHVVLALFPESRR